MTNTIVRRARVSGASPAAIPQLPEDVILWIVDILKSKNATRSLAQLRGTSRDMYLFLSTALYRILDDPLAAAKLIASLYRDHQLHRLELTRPSPKLGNSSIHPLDLRPIMHSRWIAANATKLTLDFMAVEHLVHAFSSRLGLLSARGMEVPALLPSLRTLVFRYHEQDPSRWWTRDYTPGALYKYTWDSHDRSFKTVQWLGQPPTFIKPSPTYLQSSTLAHQKWDSIAPLLRCERLCINPHPAGDAPDKRLVRGDRLALYAKQSTYCRFPISEFATVHNINVLPCYLPEAKIVRIAFLMTSLPQSPFLQRYTTIQAMLLDLPARVEKVVLVGVERGIRTGVRGDMDKDKFYAKLRRCFRRAKENRDLRLGGKRKLKWVLLDGRRGVRKCADCGSESSPLCSLLKEVPPG